MWPWILETHLEPFYPLLMFVSMTTSLWLIPSIAEAWKTIWLPLAELYSGSSPLPCRIPKCIVSVFSVIKPKLHTQFSLWYLNVQIWFMAHKCISSGNFVIACPTVVLPERDRTFFVLLIKLRDFYISLLSALLLLLYLLSVLLSPDFLCLFGMSLVSFNGKSDWLVLSEWQIYHTDSFDGGVIL